MGGEKFLMTNIAILVMDLLGKLQPKGQVIAVWPFQTHHQEPRGNKLVTSQATGEISKSTFVKSLNVLSHSQRDI
jgi:hypothetical protein